jgi:F420-dependent oxidoreductase-like protein
MRNATFGAGQATIRMRVAVAGSDCGVDGEDELRLPAPCVVVLVGPGASGKSTWAAAHFPADQVVSSDRLRAMVGSAEDDLAAGADAFALLTDVVRMRVSRGLTTVVDTLGLDAARRCAWLALARAHRLPCVAVVFDVPAAECRARNRDRARRIPADVLAAQLRSFASARTTVSREGFDQVISPRPVRVVTPAFTESGAAARRQLDRPTGLRFGLHLGRFGADRAALAPGLRAVAGAAEEAGFDAMYVMDHFRQIPQIGRAWDDFLESYTTLGYLAACTSRVRLGALVSGVTYRNVAHLGKIVASLDVLSGGRAVCGLGLAWFEAEHTAYGWPFPAVPQRYALLEDALRLLPVLWGPGSPAFRGEVLTVPEAACYPRPLQAHVPIVLGGGGERRTLRLAARYADAANVFGDLDTVVRKRDVLRAHCLDVGRDPTAVELTHLSTALVGDTGTEVAAAVERLRPRRQDPARYAASVHAGTVSDHIGRFRRLAEAGVAEVMLRLPDLTDLTDPTPVLRMAQVISSFR